MVVTEHEASTFIQDYTKLMLEIYGPIPTKPERKLLDLLAAARAKYAVDRSLLEGALCGLANKSEYLEPEVVNAVQRLELKKWIYLRDTTSHSIFIDPSGDKAYAVLGLTERIRTIVGGSGAIVETALLQYHDRYICDGIVTNVLWLSPNYKKEYTKLLGTLRAQGSLHKTPIS